MIEAIAAGAMALGSLAQLYNAEKARGAEKARLKEIEKLYDSIKPPDYDLSIMDPPELHAERLNDPKFSSMQAAPKFNMEKLTPEELKMVGKYIPEVAPYIAEESPKVLEKSPDMAKAREAQLNALRKFQEIGSGGFDPEFAQKVQESSRRAQQEAQSRQDSILQDFARRGQGGSGLSLAAQLGGASQAMDRSAQTNMAAASQAYRNQLNALAQGAQLGSQINQEDTGFQGRNADIINQFNARTAAGRQNYENQRAGSLNQANQYNLGVEQQLANANVDARNKFSQNDQSRLDNLLKYTTEFNTKERDSLYNRLANERSYGNQISQQNYNNQVGARDRVNNLAQQGFTNQMNIASGKSGNAMIQNQALRQQTQDRNAAIQGLANAGVNYATYSGDRDAKDRELKAKYGSAGYDPEEDEGYDESAQLRSKRNAYIA